jgi:hypothetical protein
LESKRSCERCMGNAEGEDGFGDRHHTSLASAEMSEG